MYVHVHVYNHAYKWVHVCIQARSQKLQLGGSFVQNCGLFKQNTGPFKQNCGPFQQNSGPF